MRSIFFILLFSFNFLFSQTVFTDNFDSFYNIDTTGQISSYLFSDANEGDLNLDLKGTNDLSLTGWASHAVLLDSLLGSSILVNNASSLSFSDDHNLYVTTDDFKPGTGDFTLVAIIKTPPTLTTYKTIFNGGLVFGTSYQAYSLHLNATAQLTAWITDGSVAYMNKNASISANTNYVLVFSVDRDGEQFVTSNQVKVITQTTTNSTDIQPNQRFTIGAKYNNTDDFIGYITYIAYYDRALSEDEAKKIGYLGNNWVSTNGNVSRNDFEFAQTAWSDTLCVPLPDATLGNNQEWVLTSSNIDDVTAWIGSRSSAKSVKKSITGGVSFASNTTYFGDGFSLVGDSLVVVFPADTASIDNIVLKKAQHHLKSSANRGWLGW